MSRLPCIFVIACCGSAASAQMNMPSSNTYPQNFYVPSVDEIVTDEMPENLGVDDDGKRFAEVVTSYKPSLQRRAANLARFVELRRKTDPSGANEMQALLSRVDLMKVSDNEMQKVGMSVSNVADAYAVWWVNAWLGARGRNENLSRSQMQAVKRQTEAKLRASKKFRDSDDALKQELAEVFIVQAVMISAAVDVGKENPSMMPKIQEAIVEGARRTGVDVRSVDLTEDGFVMREGANAADGPVVPGEEPEALAAAAARDDGGEGLDDYALPALGGAAALAAVFFLGRSAGRRG